MPGQQLEELLGLSKVGAADVGQLDDDAAGLRGIGFELEGLAAAVGSRNQDCRNRGLRVFAALEEAGEDAGVGGVADDVLRAVLGVAFWVHDMPTVRQKAATVEAIFAFDALCLVVFAGLLKWI